MLRHQRIRCARGIRACCHLLGLGLGAVMLYVAAANLCLSQQRFSTCIQHPYGSSSGTVWTEKHGRRRLCLVVQQGKALTFPRGITFTRSRQLDSVNYALPCLSMPLLFIAVLDPPTAAAHSPWLLCAVLCCATGRAAVLRWQNPSAPPAMHSRRTSDVLRRRRRGHQRTPVQQYTRSVDRQQHSLWRVVLSAMQQAAASSLVKLQCAK